ncbi:MAG: hypothetical protein MI750_11575 [Xanthomonadales bacterium]|jgi:hypothetical protein|nr:hypothetical protein [Xanthomonadales bacterium]
MNVQSGQILSVGERGGPTGEWDYPQAYVEVLQSFNGKEQAQAFAESNAYQPLGASYECQFVQWLVSNQWLKLISAPEYWNVSATVADAKRV